MLTANRELVPAQTDNSWGTHFRASVYLGVPFIGAQLAQLAINTTDVLMVGRLGAVQLAAIILATQFFFTVFIFGSGFANAVVPMVAQAQGRGDQVSVRRSVRMGMWVVLLYGLMTAPILWMAEPILLFAGQKPEVSALAAEYLHIAQWAIFPSLIFMVLRAFLSGLERAGIILYVTLATLVLNAVLCYLLIYGHFGFPALGIFGAAVAALGVPISLTILAEVSLFTVASLLMGTIGTIELAAHGIALQFASIAFMIPLGLAQAGTVRVGLAYGSGDLVGVRRAAVAVLALGCGFAAIGSTIFALLPYQLATLYLDTARPDAAEVLAFAGPLIVIAGAFQLVDGLQAIAAGMLRGLKDTTVPMILAMISYWPIGFVCAWVFAFPLEFGGVGVWFGFVLGLAAAALLLNWRFFRLIHSMRSPIVV
ncbi:putative multidrug efflux protein [Sinorhizobium fredii HH103]|uniref:Multidrug-efflux transporter n=1 Tax=Sinorhizobium fredii (strain HH103) TaxID=1117943 RepID=G9A6U1_SINF1|nr:MATE family efflux transporter [Sinorhizobium fredii]CCE95971.1 putative multidrug efflux protein [Sinorhizobium fredii HH103]